MTPIKAKLASQGFVLPRLLGFVWSLRAMPAALSGRWPRRSVRDTLDTIEVGGARPRPRFSTLSRICLVSGRLPAPAQAGGRAVLLAVLEGRSSGSARGGRRDPCCVALTFYRNKCKNDRLDEASRSGHAAVWPPSGNEPTTSVSNLIRSDSRARPSIRSRLQGRRRRCGRRRIGGVCRGRPPARRPDKKPDFRGWLPGSLRPKSDHRGRSARASHHGPRSAVPCDRATPRIDGGRGAEWRKKRLVDRPGRDSRNFRPGRADGGH
jgi:hypothetical protein